MPFASTPLQISNLATLDSPSHSRAWLTAPHPTLPLLATCSSDKTVRIYSLTTLTLLSTISGGHKRSIRTCAWKPNLKGESVLATGSFDASVGIWRRSDDDENGKRGAVKDVLSGVDFEARDRDIQSGVMGIGAGENAEEEEEEEWRFAIVLDGHESEVKSVAWSAGGNLLATCSRDKSVWIWEEMAGDDDYETVAVMQEHEGDVKCVAWHPSEELLASASYDDEVRLWREDVDDWGCCGVLRGHEGTVWFVAWEVGEGRATVGGVHDGDGLGDEKVGKEKWLERRQRSGPRLLSCSDDLSIRVWRRRPKEKVQQQSRLSIIKSAGTEEDWVEEARLPVVHGRPVYAVAWGKGGRVVSTGGDGRVVVYEERWRRGGAGGGKLEESAGVDGVPEAKGVEGPIVQQAIQESPHIPNGQQPQHPQQQQQQQPAPNPEEASPQEIQPAPTEWVVVAHLEAAHGVFEINHVAWASRRRDRSGSGGAGDGRSGFGDGDTVEQEGEEAEEVIVTTGDDGAVKVWCLG